MYDPELRARSAASRTSSFMKTRERGISFMPGTDRKLFTDIDPRSGARRLQGGFHYADSMKPRPAINGRRRPFLDRINESRQLSTKRFFGRKFQLVHRAFLRSYRVALGDMLIRKRLYFVLCHIVIAHRGAIRSRYDNFAEFARRVVPGFDRRQYRRTFLLVVFQGN